MHRSLACLLLLCIPPGFAVSAAAFADGPVPAAVIFDTDMGSDCDDAGALALLHHYADRGRVEIIGCMFSSGRVPFGAGVVEAINIYYGRPNIPVGAYQGDDVGDPVDKMTAEKLARDTAAFGHRIVHNRDAADLTQLGRRLLAGQPDGSVTYLTVGHTKGLYDLLTSAPDGASPHAGEALIRRKVRRWVALGALRARNADGAYRQDWNFFHNGTAPYTEYLIRNFPAPIVFVDAGHGVMTGAGLKHTPPGNIVRTAYRDWLWNHEQKLLTDQRPSWDLAAVYYAVEGLGYFLESESLGCLEFDAARGCRWRADGTDHRQTYVWQREGIAPEFAAYLNRLIALPPAIRGGGG